MCCAVKTDVCNFFPDVKILSPMLVSKWVDLLRSVNNVTLWCYQNITVCLSRLTYVVQPKAYVWVNNGRRRKCFYNMFGAPRGGKITHCDF